MSRYLYTEPTKICLHRRSKWDVIVKYGLFKKNVTICRRQAEDDDCQESSWCTGSRYVVLYCSGCRARDIYDADVVRLTLRRYNQVPWYGCCCSGTRLHSASKRCCDWRRMRWAPVSQPGRRLLYVVHGRLRETVTSRRLAGWADSDADVQHYPVTPGTARDRLDLLLITEIFFPRSASRYQLHKSI